MPTTNLIINRDYSGKYCLLVVSGWVFSQNQINMKRSHHTVNPEMAKGLFFIALAMLLLFILAKCQEENSYKMYKKIDDCVFLETYHESFYSSSKTNTLMGCDSATIVQFEKKLGKRF